MKPAQSQRISSKATIFTAEANAINMAINNIEKSDNCFVTRLSILPNGSQIFKGKNPIILKLKQKIHTILAKGIAISFLWVPSKETINIFDLLE